MAARWGPGPVFVYESILSARRWQVYAGRSVGVLALLIGLCVVWSGRNRGNGPRTLQELARLGEGFFYALAGIQLSLVLVAAPVAAAGSICIDRARGTLLHMLATDLSDVEIVLGKLIARLAPVFGIIFSAAPVAALAALLGGIDLSALLGLFAVSLALAILSCTLALAISLTATKVHEVVMAVYILISAWLLALPIWNAVSRGTAGAGPPAWFEKTNPFVLVFWPYVQPGSVSWVDDVRFIAVILAVAAGLIVLVIARLRKTVMAEAAKPPATARWRLPSLSRVFPTWAGPALDSNPVLWREWHRNRPSRLARRLWFFVLLVTWALALWGTYDIITTGVRVGPGALPFAFLFRILFGLLIISALAPTTLSEERLRGTLDVLLATPVSTASIVRAKWWGVYRRALVLALLPVLTAVLVAAAAPDVPAYAAGILSPRPVVPLTSADRIMTACLTPMDFLASCALIVSIGIALATWVRRVGRAVVISVICYFCIGIGWILLVELSVSLVPSRTQRFIYDHRWIEDAIIGLSPIAGSMNAIEAVNQVAYESRFWRWVVAWSVMLFKAFLAGGLLWLTIKTFDRCLGRMPEAAAPSRPVPKPVPLELAGVPG